MSRRALPSTTREICHQIGRAPLRALKSRVRGSGWSHLVPAARCGLVWLGAPRRPAVELAQGLVSAVRSVRCGAVRSSSAARGPAAASAAARGRPPAVFSCRVAGSAAMAGRARVRAPRSAQSAQTSEVPEGRGADVRAGGCVECVDELK